MDIYWEEYCDQDIRQYTHIGVGCEKQPITDIEAQVQEFKRKYGKNCKLLIFRIKEEETA